MNHAHTANAIALELSRTGYLCGKLNVDMRRVRGIIEDVLRRENEAGPCECEARRKHDDEAEAERRACDG